MSLQWNVLIAYRSIFKDAASGPMAAADKRIRESATRTNALSAESARAATASVARSAATLSTVGLSLTKYVSIPIALAGAASVKMASDFQGSMTRVSALTEDGRKNFGKWSREILTIAPKLGTAPNKLAQSLYFVASAGLRANQVIPTLVASAKDAAATFGDSAKFTDVLTSSLNAYSAQGLTAQRASDILLQTIKVGKAEPDQLAESLGRILSPAAQLGVSFKDLGGGIAALTNRGLDAAEAITGLRQILFTLLHPAHQTQEQMTAIGLSAKGLRADLGTKGLYATLQLIRKAAGDNKEALGTLFPNIRALNAFLALTGQNASAVRKTFNEMNGAVGATNRGFGAISQTVGFKTHKALAQIQVDLIQIGDIMLPTVTRILDSITKLANSFSHLSKGTQETIVKFGLIAASIGPIIFFGSKLVGTFANIALALTSFGAVGPVLLFAGIAGAAYLVYKNWNKVGPALRSFWPKLRDTISGFYSAIEPLLKTIAQVITNVLLFIINLLNGHWSQAWDNAKKAVENFGFSLKNVATGVKDVFDLMSHSVVGFVLGTAGLLIVIGRLKALASAMRGLALTEAVFGAVGTGGTGAAIGEQLAFFGGGKPGLLSRIKTNAAARNASSLAKAGDAAVLAANADAAVPSLFAPGVNAFEGPVAGLSKEEEAALRSEQSISKLTAASNLAGAATAEMTTSIEATAPALIGPTGIAVAAIAAGVGLTVLANHFLGGESAADRLRDSLSRLSGEIKGFASVGGKIAGSALLFQRDNLALQGYRLQLKQEKKDLADAKKGTDAYQQAQLNVKNTLLDIHQVQQQVISDRKTLQSEIVGANARGQAALKDLPVGANAFQTTLSNLNAHSTVNKGEQIGIVTRLQQGIIGLNEAERERQALQVGAGRIPILLSDQDLKNVAAAKADITNLNGTLGKLRTSFATARSFGLSPFSDRMQKLIGTMAVLQEKANGLSGRSLVTLEKGFGRILKPSEIATLQKFGGLTPAIQHMAEQLGRIPTSKEIVFESNLIRDTPGGKAVIPAIDEFEKLLHFVPNQTVMNILVKHQSASLAIAALIGKTKALPSTKQLRILDNIRADAIPRIAELIKKLGHIPGTKKIHAVVTETVKQDRKSQQDNQRILQLRGQEAHRGGSLSVDDRQFERAIDAAKKNDSQLNKQVSKTQQKLIKITFQPTKDTAAQQGHDLGAAVITGADGGATAAAAEGALSTIISQYVTNAINAGKKAARSSSPSRETHEKIGVPLIQGIVTGVQSQSKSVGSAIAKTVNDGVKAAQKAIGSGTEFFIGISPNHMPGGHRGNGAPPPPPPPGSGGGSGGGGGGGGGHHHGPVRWWREWMKKLDDLIDAHGKKAVKDAEDAIKKAARNARLGHADAIERKIRSEIRGLERGKEDKAQTDEIKRLKTALDDIDKAITKRLTSRANLLEHRFNLRDLREQGLELRQQLAGTFDTAAGGQQRANFIEHRIEPLLRQQIKNLKEQEREAKAAGHSKSARDIAEQLAQKQNDLLQRQLDAQTAIKDATQATADAMQQFTGSVGFSFNDLSFRDLIGIGVGG